MKIASALCYSRRALGRPGGRSAGQAMVDIVEALRRGDALLLIRETSGSPG